MILSREIVNELRNNKTPYHFLPIEHRRTLTSLPGEFLEQLNDELVWIDVFKRKGDRLSPTGIYRIRDTYRVEMSFPDSHIHHLQGNDEAWIYSPIVKDYFKTYEGGYWGWGFYPPGEMVLRPLHMAPSVLGYGLIQYEQSGSRWEKIGALYRDSDNGHVIGFNPLHSERYLWFPATPARVRFSRALWKDIVE